MLFYLEVADPQDLISGSTAFAAALPTEEFGKASVMIEEDTIDGTCELRLSRDLAVKVWRSPV